MPSILNSDDGVVSGTSGLKTTGGNDGLLNIQSNGSTILAVTGSGISVTGTVSQTGVSTFAAGTVSAPSITFTGDTNTGIFSPAADTIAFTEGGAESMRIDSSGKLLVGTTTATLNTRLNAKLGVVSTGSGEYGGAVITSYSGTSSGPASFIDFNRSRGTTDGSMTAVASGDSLGYIVFRGSDGTNFVDSSLIKAEVDGTPGTNDMPGRLAFYTSADGTASATERMRIDSSGNVGIGTSTPLLTAANRTNLTVNGTTDSIVVVSSGGTARGWLYGVSGTTVLAAGTSSSLNFEANGAERARITSGGDFLVGATAKLGNGGGIYVATGGANIQTLTTNSTTNNAYYVLRIYANAVEKGYIYYDGTNVSYTNLSDYRLKENIAPMTGALAKVAQLNPCTFTWKNGGHSGQGFIAHELQEVCPDAVTGEKDATEIQQVEVSPAIPATYDEDGNELTPAVEATYEEREVPVYQGVDTSFLVATLTAAIQELKAELDAAKERIATLEAK